jgi:tetratricopeptide (TPR) repeat protein
MTKSAVGPPALASESTRHAPRPGLLLCCLLVAVLAAYIPVLGGPFIWDDHHLVEESPLVHELHPLSDYFRQGFWQGDDVEPGRTYYRPLSILSLALDEKIYGENSSGFHITNLIFHLLSTCLLFGLLRARAVGAYGATLGTALWALHPRLTEAVAWISGRTDVLAGFFVLCALLAQRRRSPVGAASTAVCLLLGLLCKEVALAGVAAVVVLEFLGSTTGRERLRRIVPALLTLLVYLALRANAIGLSSERKLQLLPWGARLEACAAAIGHYFCMLCGPWFPDIQIGRLNHPSHAYVLFGGAVLLAGVVGSAFIARRSPRISPELAGALTLTTVALGLVLHLIPFSINVLAADRFLYLPLAGIALAVTPLLASTARKGVVAALAGALVASFATATFVRASSWADEVGFWTTAFREASEDPSLACIELGSLYAKSGLFRPALAVFGRGANPAFEGYAIAINNAATVLARTGQYREAAQLLSPVAQNYPEIPLFSLNLALFDSYLNRFDSARAHLARALTLYPGYPQGNALAQRLPEMEQQRQALDALPADAPALERARLLGKLGLADESLLAWGSALSSPGCAQKDFEEGLWFALREGSADNVDAWCPAYGQRFRNQRDDRLDLVCDTRAELVRRLREAWPSLNLAGAP